MPKCSECNDEGMVGTSICPKCNGYGGTKRAPFEKKNLRSKSAQITVDQVCLDYSGYVVVPI